MMLHMMHFNVITDNVPVTLNEWEFNMLLSREVYYWWSLQYNHSSIIKCWKWLFNVPLYRRCTCFYLSLGKHWSNLKIFQYVRTLAKEGCGYCNSIWWNSSGECFEHLLTWLAPVRWHRGVCITQLPHRCLQMWQSKASSTQSGLSREKPVWTTCEGEDGHKYLIIASDGIKSNQIESK